ncbi:MAG TPA: PH domain-containing protein [Candidatus Agrococcus pullicola]|uniref:PH domain-containing protein n=1 Tax=Candidatus Agrococcus pullicola TaxID=2838429 RepID=A0A9D1YTA7_9MICO|nr:PH domain-containing protein [Candidatus Agrococcus pullicola]
MNVTDRHELESRSSERASWLRLSPRIIWVDLAISILASLPALVAIWLFDVDSGGQIWPLIGLAIFGVVGAIFDVVRWVFTRYRITATHVELKTGVVLRRHRVIQRDRIRTVDIEAKLRHRVAKMRVVNIGAGQQAAAGESALALDALSADDARALQTELLTDVNDANDVDTPSGETGPEQEDQPADGSGAPIGPEHGEPIRVFARFRPSWFVFNMFNIWAYVLALGLGWGALWLLSTFGIDLYGIIVGLMDWSSIGWLGTALIGLIAAGALGAVGLGVNYFTENWNLELARVRGRDGTVLRTRKGLFTTREINRDENRIRGAQVSEPVLWRWMGASDTSVITTGLDEWSMAEPAAILPRGPVRRAREVAGDVLGDTENPFHKNLARHPRRALLRRLVLAAFVAAAVAAALAVLAFTDVVPHTLVWAAAALLPIFLLAAVVAYRALGHTLTDRYVITRSGLMSRATTVLQRSAVSTVVISESPMQRLLRLRTVSTMTAAGSGGYDTPDLDRKDSLAFALKAAPGILDPFVARADAPLAQGAFTAIHEVSNARVQT